MNPDLLQGMEKWAEWAEVQLAKKKGMLPLKWEQQKTTAGEAIDEKKRHPT